MKVVSQIVDVMNPIKFLVCSAALGFSPLVGGASELGLDLPRLSYKVSTPLSSPLTAEAGPDWKSMARQFGAVTQKGTRPIPSASPRFELSIIRPKSGFDYKMRTVEADSAIDPSMIFPKQTPFHRGLPTR